MGEQRTARAVGAGLSARDGERPIVAAIAAIEAGLQVPARRAAAGAEGALREARADGRARSGDADARRACCSVWLRDIGWTPRRHAIA